MTSALKLYPDVSSLPMIEAKQALRAAVRKNRSKRSRNEKLDANAQWEETISQFIGDAPAVASYISVANEPGTRELSARLVREGHRLLVPKLGPKLARQWAWYISDDDLSAQAPGRPPAPSGQALDSRALKEVSVIILPALLVNRQGYRLGQGGGWYDRVLKTVPKNVKIAAMVFPDEFVDMNLPHDNLDMKVSYAILPDRVIKLGD
ncbi:5-formyltetrahydrofolate cyclo-ligase [Actinotignum urinale]|uniref:5-formyltetrahydrofolate cyclo-ligase n=1 Tax=Actinotignum urinale TaxID=190146 RepID=A0AAW9HJW8_9ACTO|nr:5-formyltetrahydrofolate cyclo-ligase [Actinotignum urinale]MDY5128705.1 5-formyltetrahydrofolate cyclo-ligase [Actinotignum urinale]MDY5133026.1 5-formyltetrahydrofolate cyclo-ligase [Actinotignum urinale]MDY5152233.1 5-formyltetrahydrofolate cyclo-ligase [Actinotignum urinale]MDY5154233.1 5-formyltetrahydrofolate cyclo-ligase [Actinotignum urinale]MDY5159619.1 5-formyltetrahydrofolate cyclo-ligase [Actinotignum urinale]